VVLRALPLTVPLPDNTIARAKALQVVLAEEHCVLPSEVSLHDVGNIGGYVDAGSFANVKHGNLHGQEVALKILQHSSDEPLKKRWKVRHCADARIKSSYYP
jgi:hypothetical protein